jgi:hypothetical protein
MRLSFCSRTGDAGIDRRRSSTYRRTGMTRPGVCCLAVAVLSLAGCAHSEKAPAAPAIDGGAVRGR